MDSAGLARSVEVGVDVTDVPDVELSPSPIYSLAEARTRGFGIAQRVRERLRRLTPGNGQAMDDLAPAPEQQYVEQLRRCDEEWQAEVARRLPDAATIAALNRAVADDAALVEERRVAVEVWSACLRERGFDADSFPDLIGQLTEAAEGLIAELGAAGSEGDGDDVLRHERRAAEATFECDRIAYRRVVELLRPIELRFAEVKDNATGYAPPFVPAA